MLSRMIHFEAPEAECVVFTFREGLFAVAGHDLKLRADRVSVDVDRDQRTVKAVVRADSLDVIAAVREGRELPSALSASDKKQIRESLLGVLDVGRYPEIVLEARAVSEVSGGFRVEGTLTLHGTALPVAVTTRLVAGRQEAELTVHQPDAGIRPFRAALGGLRVKPDVRVHLAIPWT